MVFVTVGNATQGFLRLLRVVEDVAINGCLRGEHIVVQSGNNNWSGPPNCQSQPFFPTREFLRLVREAEMVISHGGAGTIIQILQSGKAPVVMPRRRKHREIVDDHQMELVQALAKEGRVIPAYEPEDLPCAIEEARRRSAQPAPPAPTRMIRLVEQAIYEILGPPPCDG